MKKPDMRIAQEEIFGPVTGIIRTDDVDEAIGIANSVQYGLSASIYTHDITNVFKAITQLEFGVVYVNAPTIGAEVQLPFGGMKNTGNGHREAGPNSSTSSRNGRRSSSTIPGRSRRPRASTDRPPASDTASDRWGRRPGP